MNVKIDINLTTQTLQVHKGADVIGEYSVSTSKNGAGEELDSECTPRGKHVIVEKIGHGCDMNTVFVGRVPTGEKYTTDLRSEQPGRDWIITRILRLQGTEPGINKGGSVDTFERYVYIHGAPDDVPMGIPGSHGCIRMRNKDVIELFELSREGTEVLIHE